MRKKLFKITQVAILAIAMVFTFNCSSALEEQLKSHYTGVGNPSSSSEQSSSSYKETEVTDFVGIWRGGNTKEGYIFIFTADRKYIKYPEINSPTSAIIQMAADGYFGDATLKYYTVNDSINSIIVFEKDMAVQCIQAPCPPLDRTSSYDLSPDGNTLTLADYNIYGSITLRKISSYSYEYVAQEN